MRNHLRRSTLLASAALVAAALMASDVLTDPAEPVATEPIAAKTTVTGVRLSAMNSANYRNRPVRERVSRSRSRRQVARPARVRPAPLPVGTDVWARLRNCESGGRYNIATGNGFYGAYQFMPSTWRGLGYKGLPHQAPPEVQDEAARKLQARSGWGQWPACSRKLGLRR
jgi:resuscitation-promoting factor RpfB